MPINAIKHRHRYTAAILALACVCLLGYTGTLRADNLIEVEETFFRLTFDETTHSYRKTPVDTARPGDLIELQITATNTGETTVRNLELINTVPGGRSELVEGSFQLDESIGEYRLSPNDERFFPPSADIPPEQINYVQWLIYELPPGESATLSYRLRLLP